MPPSTPWSDADDQTLRDLWAAGLSLTAIADEMNRGKATIHRYAAKAGLSFDRSKTKAATEAKKIDAADRRVTLELLYLEKATDILAQLTEPAILTFFDIKTGKVVEHEVAKPQFADQRNIAQASATMANAANRLRDLTVDREASAVDKWTDAMIDGPADE
ncbi:hypothetical protein [Gordonia terrae]